MKVLIIGFGSIGKRHYEILKSRDNITQIDVLSSQSLANIKTYKNLDEIKDIDDYSYFVIANETAKHYQSLMDLCSKVSNKKILVEKPLFATQGETLTCSNLIYTAYNLRFHPLIEEVKKLVEDEIVYSANVICGQYLPTWRPDEDYTKSYSADIKRGGGVLRDLSHELDYMQWIFGTILDIQAINTKISDLKIHSDDLFTMIGITDKKTIINISMDYISKTPIRRLLVHTKTFTLEADLVENTLVIANVLDKKKIQFEKNERNLTYEKMHDLILTDKSHNVCHYQQALEVVKLIDSIDFKEIE